MAKVLALLVPIISLDLPCHDLNGWVDSVGYGCEYYDTEITACAQNHEQGVSPTKACCACDGGCYDNPDFQDSYGYDCSNYKDRLDCENGQAASCEPSTDPSIYCCVCGGGCKHDSQNEWCPSRTNETRKS